MLSVHIEMLLPRHKGEAAPQLQQELLQMVDQRLLQGGLIEVLICRKIQKFQHIWIFDDLLILRLRLRSLDLGRDALLVAAYKDALVEHGIDLPLQLAGAPPGLCALLQIERSSLGVVYLHQGAVMGPAQFGTQCVLNWEREVESPHIAQIADIEPSSKFLRKPL